MMEKYMINNQIAVPREWKNTFSDSQDKVMKRNNIYLSCL